MYSWEDPRQMSKEERMASRKEFYRPRTMEELFEEAQERELREEEYKEEGGMNMWHGVTLSREMASVFKDFLRQEPAILDFEPSECYSNIHIEFKTELPFSEVMDKYLDYLRNAVQNAEGNLKQYLKDNPEGVEQIIQAIREEMM